MEYKKADSKRTQKLVKKKNKATLQKTLGSKQEDPRKFRRKLKRLIRKLQNVFRGNREE